MRVRRRVAKMIQNRKLKLACLIICLGNLGCNSLRLLTKMQSGETTIAVQRVLDATRKLSNDFKLCLEKNSPHTKSELGAKVDASITFAFDGKNSQIKSVQIDLRDATQYFKGVAEQCRVESLNAIVGTDNRVHLYTF